MFYTAKAQNCPVRKNTGTQLCICIKSWVSPTTYTTWLLPHQSTSSLHDLFIDKDESYKYCGLCELLNFPCQCALGDEPAHTPISWPAPTLSFSFLRASWLLPHQAIQAETSPCWLKSPFHLLESNTKAECSDNHTQVGQTAADLLHIHWKQTVGTVGSWEGTGHKT